jgi:hypothetical protein
MIWINISIIIILKRTNQGYRLKGEIPYQKFLDFKQKYALPK